MQVDRSSAPLRRVHVESPARDRRPPDAGPSQRGRTHPRRRHGVALPGDRLGGGRGRRAAPATVIGRRAGQPAARYGQLLLQVCYRRIGRCAGHGKTLYWRGDMKWHVCMQVTWSDRCAGDVKWPLCMWREVCTSRCHDVTPCAGAMKWPPVQVPWRNPLRRCHEVTPCAGAMKWPPVRVPWSDPLCRWCEVTAVQLPWSDPLCRCHEVTPCVGAMKWPPVRVPWSDPQCGCHEVTPCAGAMKWPPVQVPWSDPLRRCHEVTPCAGDMKWPPVQVPWRDPLRRCHDMTPCAGAMMWPPVQVPWRDPPAQVPWRDPLCRCHDVTPCAGAMTWPPAQVPWRDPLRRCHDVTPSCGCHDVTPCAGDVRLLYERVTAPPGPSPPPTPQPKRTQADWEQDVRELADEADARAALQENRVPNYFASQLGKAFLLSQVRHGVGRRAAKRNWKPSSILYQMQLCHTLQEFKSQVKLKHTYTLHLKNHRLRMLYYTVLIFCPLSFYLFI